jgi:glyceraldehyde 3-phosphate dehydrogenase
MAVKVAINGFGRIGRLVFRAIVEQGLLGKEVEVVAVGDIVPADNLAYLLKYDSTQGRFNGTVLEEIGPRQGRGRRPRRQRPRHQGRQRQDPGRAAVEGLGVEIVIESTGLFTDAEKAKGHLAAGAKKVIISAPAKGEDITVVMGVNDEKYDPAKHTSSPTPPARPTAWRRSCHVLLKEGFGIEEGLMTTIHSLHRHAEDRGRPEQEGLEGRPQAAINIIPSTTGAAKAVGWSAPRSRAS